MMRVGIGGAFGLEKPRLYLTLDADPPAGNIITIVKAKNFNGRNPNRMQLRFSLRDGAHMKVLEERCPVSLERKCRHATQANQKMDKQRDNTNVSLDVSRMRTMT